MEMWAPKAPNECCTKPENLDRKVIREDLEVYICKTCQRKHHRVLMAVAMQNAFRVTGSAH